MTDYGLDSRDAPALGLEYVGGHRKGSKYDFSQELSFDAASIVAWAEDVMDGKATTRTRIPTLIACYDA